MENFHQSGVITKQAHVAIPDGLFEEEHGRNGFFGRVAHLYHENPPVGWTNIEGELKPRYLPLSFDKSHNLEEFFPILFNQDVSIYLGTFTKSPNYYFRNADEDELWFVHEGNFKLETSFGHLECKNGDYIVIPRGTTYKPFINSKIKILRVLSKSEFEQPERGMLGPNALYDQTAIKIPNAAKGSEINCNEYKVLIKRLNSITTVTYPFNPLDVAGWKGSLYVYKLSIYDFCPIMSHKYHMPPSAHTTFVAKNLVICSFVERPLEDSKHKVLKVPFYHSNIDFDEVLFYHQGSFFSRDNVGPGSITFHPQGIHHGPHPNAFKNAESKTHTDEFAVMVDTKNPLQMSDWFMKNEDQNYWKSWMKK